MSKGWPDPFHDTGDDFWNFDNMVSEYEWEQQRKRGELPHQNQKNTQNEQGSSKWIPIIAGLAILFVISLIWPIFWFFLILAGIVVIFTQL